MASTNLTRHTTISPGDFGLRRDIGNKSEIAKSLLNIFSYHLKQKHYDEALSVIDEVLKIGNETNSLELQRDSYQAIQMVERERGNYKEAFDASVKFKKFGDSIQDQFTGSELAKLQLQYDFEKAEQANILEQNRI